MEKDFAIVVVEGSGRACDAIAALVKKAERLNKTPCNCEVLVQDTDDSGIYLKSSIT